MARMIGRIIQPSCPKCRVRSGPDCPDNSRTRTGQRAYEDRQWRKDQYLQGVDVFEKLKEALHRVGGIAEADAHAVAKAVHDDIKPLFDSMKADLLAELTKIVDAARTDVPKVAQDVAEAITGPSADA